MSLRNIEDNEDIDSVYKGEWHYNNAEARHATKDRRSFLAISITNNDGTDLLGVLYLDAKRKYAFTAEMIEKIQPFLRYFAEALIPA
jgi:hypothetical protein